MAKSDKTVDDLEVSAEEFLQYFGLAVVVFGISVLIFWLAKLYGGGEAKEEEVQGAQGGAGRGQRQAGGNRRAAQLRNRRGRRVGKSYSILVYLINSIDKMYYFQLILIFFYR